MNENLFEDLRTQLSIALENSCSELVDVVQDLTPIDTKRLYESTRIIPSVIEGDLIKSGVIIGGIELFGILREQDIKRMVDYAIYVEYSQFYIQGNMGIIISSLLSSLQQNMISVLMNI
jgi:hypothetical protein